MFHQYFNVLVEPYLEIETSCRLIDAEDTDTKFPGALLDCVPLGSSEECCATATAAKWFRHDEIADGAY